MGDLDGDGRSARVDNRLLWALDLHDRPAPKRTHPNE